MNGLLSRSYHKVLDLIQEPEKVKSRHEFGYWKKRKKQEGIMSQDHYQQFYTTHFGIDERYYHGRKILDIGCGPRGSLEWIDSASLRIGIDPLVDNYRKLGIRHHKMQYVAAHAEHIPFPDDYFDVVCSFNSLDHVNNLDQTICEIIRVVAPGGLFLLLTDVDHDPTICEPVCFSWNIVEKFIPSFHVLEEKHFEKMHGGMYESIIAGVPYDHSNRIKRYGILSAKFMK